MCKLVQGTRGGVLFEPLHAHLLLNVQVGSGHPGGVLFEPLHAHPLLNVQVGSGHPWGCAIRAPARSPIIKWAPYLPAF